MKLKYQSNNIFTSNATLTFFLSIAINSIVIIFSRLHRITDPNGASIGLNQGSQINIADYQFYYNSASFYFSDNFLSNLNNLWLMNDVYEKMFKSEISGPLIPFVLKIVNFEIFPLLIIYTLMNAIALWFLVGIGEKFLNNNSLKIYIFILLLNPYNLFFVLKPGAEIPFFLIFSMYLAVILRIVKKSHFSYKLILSIFFIILLGILTRPTGLVLAFSAIPFLFSIVYTTNDKIKRNTLLIMISFIILLSIIFIAIYKGYYLRATDYDSEYFFGLTYLNIIDSLNTYPNYIKYPIYALWRIVNWILSSTGIRDSIANIRGISGSPEWVVIMRVAIGLFLYLPVFMISLFSLLLNILDYLKERNASLIFPVIPSIFSLLCIIPNIIFFPNERYLFPVYSGFLLTSLFFIERLRLSRINL